PTRDVSSVLGPCPGVPEEHEHEHGEAESLEAYPLRGDLEAEKPGQEQNYCDQEQNRLPTLTQHLDCKHYATLPCHDRATPCGGTKRVSAKNGAGSSTDRPSARQPRSLIRASTAAAQPTPPSTLGWA